MSDLADILDIDKAAKKVLNDAAASLAQATYGKAVEMANERLKTRRQMFIEALKIFPVNDDVWVVELGAKARWIDEGLKQHSMLDNLLKSPKAKRAKDGSKYIVVPFEHGPGKGPTNSTQAQQDIVGTLKKHMGRNFGKIEKNADGSPKLGKIASFDIMDAPLKTNQGPGQGWGPIGDVRQGPNERQIVGGGPGGGGTPFLQGVNVYQHEVEDPKTKKKSVKKSIMTFRVASSKHKGQGRWEHPGLEPVNIMDEVEKWAQDTWERELGPLVAKAIGQSL